MIPTCIRPLGSLSIIVMALVLHACTAPGGAIPSEVDTPVASGGGAAAGDAALPQETAKPAEDESAAVDDVPASDDIASYRIAPDDLLKIKVAPAEELSSEARVSEDGSIVLPLIGAVHVGDLTPGEAEQRIAEILGKDYLQDPKVSVAVAE